MTKRILAVDDDPEILDILKMMLELEKYEVVTAPNGVKGLSYFREEYFDLAILDLNLPDIDGQHLCKIFRNESDVPILILSARDDVSDKIICLEYGADDYLTKPFESMELIARIKAILRRTESYQETREIIKEDEIEFHGFLIDLKNRSVVKNTEKIPVTPKEFEILVYLSKNRGKVLDREEIIKDIWGEDNLYKWSRSVDVHIKNLRHKLEVNPKNPDIIQTVSGVGYKVKK